jgi:uncharacterized protein YyaL (SSP411 family)
VANRLAKESSPYLLLHAENPVDWYPWGEEAFERARQEDRPIFLSVGYSTCYWCHVMERESFSDPEIAKQMNESFVNIKVDREERPDVDEIYMAATQVMTRSGGWPNSVFLTPDLEPFFAGTYFPPRDGLGRPGFPQVLTGVREAWLLRRPEIAQQAAAVAEAMRASLAGGPERGTTLPDASVADDLQADLAARFDPGLGGFGPAPKFPSPSNLAFLLDRAADPDARDMLVVTLDRMARGGIMDHLAGGFHRYSTDAAWLVPHFEKMLYDNAALAALYAGAAPLAPEEGFDRVARFTAEFVLREMTSPEGAFLSAIDAETDGHEGAYYTWTEAELAAALPGEEGALFRRVYGLEGAPTFEGDRYVVHQPLPLRDVAQDLGLSEETLRERLDEGRRGLLAVRERRAGPLVDDKVLTDWNGLMISGLARTGQLLGEARYVEAARRAAEFVLQRIWREGSGTLRHAFREGRARVPAFLDDYAFLVDGLLSLRRASGEPRWLENAVALVEEQERRLGDGDGGGFFAAGEDPRLLFRARPAFDGAVASGNGVAVLNLLELADVTGDPRWRERGEAVVRAFADGIARAPLAHVTLIRAVGRLQDAAPVREAPSSSPVSPAPSALDALEDEARDAVEIEAHLGQGAEDVWKPFVVELVVRPGFHVNANATDDPALVPTVVGGVMGGVRNVRYPPGEEEAAVPVYRGRVRIEGEVEHRGGGASALEVTFQACDESRCLPPVSRLVRLR